MGNYPSSFPSQEPLEATNQHSQVPYRSHQPIPWAIFTTHVDNTMLQQCPHHGIVSVLLGPLKGFQDMVHHHCLVPKLVVQGSTRNPVMIPPVLHHCKVDPLNNTPSEFIKLHLDGALPAGLTGNVPLPWSSYGTKHPFEKCSATSSI